MPDRKRDSIPMIYPAILAVCDNALSDALIDVPDVDSHALAKEVAKEITQWLDLHGFDPRGPEKFDTSGLAVRTV